MKEKDFTIYMTGHTVVRAVDYLPVVDQYEAKIMTGGTITEPARTIATIVGETPQQILRSIAEYLDRHPEDGFRELSEAYRGSLPST